MSNKPALDGILQATGKDITDRRKAAESLQANEAELIGIVENLATGITISDLNGHILRANPAHQKMFGYGLDELKTMVFSDFTHPDDVGNHQAAYDGLICGEIDHFNMRKRFIHREGHIVWAQVTVSLIRDNNKKPVSVVGMVEDITARMKAEMALQKSEREYKSLFKAMLNGFALHEIICDDHGKPIDYRFLAVNPAFEKLTGMKAKDLIGKTMLEVLPGTEKQWIDIYGRVALTGEPASFENYSPDLDIYYYVSAYQPAKNQFACIFQDGTEEKKSIIEREQLVGKLQKALDEIKTLRGIIPICMYCKKIRDDQGAWDIIESYISEHTHAEFSHGCCPECFDEQIEVLNRKV